MNTWDVLKEVSAEGVRREAACPFVLALAGAPDAVQAARAAIVGALPSDEVTANAAEHLLTLSPPYSLEDEVRLRHADLLLSLANGPRLTEFRPADTIVVDDPAELIEQVTAHRPDLCVPLGRRFPQFRPAASERLIQGVSRVNAEFAAISSLATAFPGLAPFFPFVSGADLVMLTKNQVLMIFRLAAIHNQDLELGSRLRELLPAAGAALGWRTLARGAAAVLPGPFGLAAKTAVAFTATYLTGRAAQVWFAEGRMPSREDMAELREEAAAHLAVALSALGLKKDAVDSTAPAESASRESRNSRPAPASEESEPDSDDGSRSQDDQPGAQGTAAV